MYTRGSVTLINPRVISFVKKGRQPVVNKHVGFSSIYAASEDKQVTVTNDGATISTEDCLIVSKLRTVMCATTRRLKSMLVSAESTTFHITRFMM